MSKLTLLMRTARPTTNAAREQLLGPMAGGSAEAFIAVMDETCAPRPQGAQRGRFVLAMSSGATRYRWDPPSFPLRVSVDDRADGQTDAQDCPGQHGEFRRGALEHILAGERLIKTALDN
jgi:hypothetical protein